VDLRHRLNTLRELGPGPTILGPALYNSTLKRPTGLRKATTRLNQAFFEQGTTPPWVWSQERCQRYWSTRTSDGVDNRPADYVAKNPAIVDLMHEFRSPDVSPDSAVLELGCNAGANLERLRQLGYTDLAGLEINPTAVQELHEAFPSLAGEASVIEGSLERVLPTLETDSVDFIDLLWPIPTKGRTRRGLVRAGRSCSIFCGLLPRKGERVGIQERCPRAPRDHPPHPAPAPPRATANRPPQPRLTWLCWRPAPATAYATATKIERGRVSRSTLAADPFVDAQQLVHVPPLPMPLPRPRHQRLALRAAPLRVGP